VRRRHTSLGEITWTESDRKASSFQRRQVQNIVHQICEALATVHDHGQVVARALWECASSPIDERFRETDDPIKWCSIYIKCFNKIVKKRFVVNKTIFLKKTNKK
jgi:hypothetical protein